MSSFILFSSCGNNADKTNTTTSIDSSSKVNNDSLKNVSDLKPMNLKPDWGKDVTDRGSACSADDLIAFGKEICWHERLINYASDYKKKIISDWQEFKNYFKIKNAKYK